ncbi:murein hydrolase activator EnvC family protein [Pelagibacterium sp.]|uniref:murein hydrolase activator EnvC family protein n=1 Tax=Pelagibacterium sp. TaxID=1967288 RepID=UPI003A92B43E
MSLPVGHFLRPSLRILLAAIAGMVLTLAYSATAQEDAVPAVEDVPSQALEETTQDVQGDLENVRGEIDISEERIAEIRAEIEALDGDATQLGAELIAAGQRVDLADEDIRLIEERLEALFASEQSVRSRLDGHDRSISNLLASLQRISAQPPPAIIVDPSDALGSARAALLLGAVLPQLQERAETVTESLNELIALKQTALAESEQLNANLATLNEERLRIATIIEARKQGLEWLSDDLLREEAEAQALADRATSLEQLIAGLETRIAAITAADEATRAANSGQTVPTLDPETLRLAFADAERSEPAVPIEAAKGYLRSPVTGSTLTTYGAADGYGGQSKGLTISTANGATVSAPADGWIVHSGPFLNYGQILILNAGQDFLVVLAGLDSITIEPGAFVQMGSPIGTMGDIPNLEAGAGASSPALYIELREGGIPIDPEGWWTAQSQQQESGTS